MDKAIGSIIASPPRFCGISTFMRLPHTKKLQDVDAAIVGVPFDSDGAFRIGSRFGPEAVRSQAKLCLRNHHIAHNINPFDNIAVVDYGDCAVLPGSIERSYEIIEHELALLFQKNVVPFAIGGDHSISLPLLRAAAQKYKNIALLHFDAHLDTGDMYYNEIKYNHGTQFRRATEENLIAPEHSIQIGMNGTIYPEMTQDVSEKLGFSVISMDEADRLGPLAVADAILERVRHYPVFVSFDIDIMDVSVAPGSGAPEIGGYQTREMLRVIRALKDINIIGMDMVEVNPLYDSSGITAILAANLIYEFITLLSLKRRDDS